MRGCLKWVLYGLGALVVLGVIAVACQDTGRRQGGIDAPAQEQPTTAQTVATVSEPSPTPEPATATPEPTAPADPNRGIQFSNPVTFDSGGFASVVTLATNTTDLVKTFTVKATYKNGDQILATAVGTVNDILPGQTRAVSLISQDEIPATYETVRIDVDTMILETENTDGAEAARQIAFGPPVIGAGGFVNVEVTNNDDAAHTFTLQGVFMQGGQLIGIAVGTVNELAPGQTKTATLIVQGTAADSEAQLAVDTMIQ